MLRNKTVDARTLVRELRLRVKRGSQADIAREVGVRAPMISNVLNGRVLPCGKVLKWLGYKRVVIYRRVK